MEPFVSTEKLDSLIDKLKYNLPYSCTVYNNLLLHSRGVIDAHQFFVLKDHLEATVIFYKGKIIKNIVGVFSCESEVELVVSALLETDLIDWKNNIFCHTPDYLIEAIQRLIQQKNIGIGTVIINYDGYTCSSSTNKVSCSKEFCVRILGAAGVKRLYETWKFKEESTEELQNNIARAGLAIGVFENVVDIEQQEQIKEIQVSVNSAIPVAWMTMSADGSLGLLRTDEAFQRKGLASVVVTSTAISAANQGYIPHAYIGISNSASRNMFEKLGWKKTHKVSWIWVSCPKSAQTTETLK